MDILLSMYHLMILMLIPAFLGSIALIADTYTQWHYYQWIRQDRECKTIGTPIEDYEQYENFEDEDF